MSKPTFADVPERPCLPDEEAAICQRWKEEDSFKESLRRSEGKPVYTFYDGPPFATGLPHYGHILAGTIKDVVTRYAHQTGHYVERRFGWDCHGLPVEYEIDKTLGITSRDQVLEMGIDKYNEECEKIVMRYASEWRTIVERLGRWIDFDNDYRTMNLSFMESVWWVFKQLFNKGLVYRAHKVMPFSTACTTPLSNFEANLNYKDVNDPSIVISFPVKDLDSVELLAWTTTPWTLPSNIALCVNPNFTYLKVKVPVRDRCVIVTETRLQWLCHELKIADEDAEVVERMQGSTLVGWKYEPLFDYFANTKWAERGYTVVADTYVSDDTGTGIVHQAPAFGEDDMRVCLAAGIAKRGESLCPVDDNGCFTAEVTDFTGMHVKSCDKPIKNKLKAKNRLLVNAEITHSYPHCWRSETPLIYKAVASWFIEVEKIKEGLLRANEQTYWVPNHVKENRFHNWLRDARDWCVSRNRYWGTPVPLWVSEDYSQIVCIGSVEELQRLSGTAEPITNIHRQFVDHILIPDPRGAPHPPLKRVSEVFDCWFESGSMPYAQQHYPFENEEKFKAGFPADFLAEGIDQTRGWFYTLTVLSTALFDKPAWKNLVVNGLVLAEDGKKMSKRLKNYPDPMEVVHKHGADALRMYLINSPVVRAESLRFSELGVKGVVRDLLLPWYHSYRFLCQEATRHETSTGEKFTVGHSDTATRLDNLMDRWIASALEHLNKSIREEMKFYRLYNVLPQLVGFLDNLTNWYLRLNRDRMRGTNGVGEARVALRVLYDVLRRLCVLMAPFTPYITELIYGNLKKALPEGHSDCEPSVHFVMMPQVNTSSIQEDIERAVKTMQTVIVTGRVMRERRKVSTKQPVKELTIISRSEETLKDVELLSQYIQEELNAVHLHVSQDASSFQRSATPNFKTLGQRLGSDMKKVTAEVRAMTDAQLEQYELKGEVTVSGHLLSGDDILVKKSPKQQGGTRGRTTWKSEGRVTCSSLSTSPSTRTSPRWLSAGKWRTECRRRARPRV
eukprot:GHVU01198480.1.p1 GENE.GHVU01198480.1~~GHVU01198480.1.p1  ORF type:complete len:1014 (+),score=247.26 GHVU01198480.1:1900-4941(+)